MAVRYDSPGRTLSFGSMQKRELLDAMGRTRHYLVMCAAAAGFGEPRYALCDAVTRAIDALAADLTVMRSTST